MGRAIEQGQSAELLHQPAAFFENFRSEGVHRQALTLQHIDIAEKADGVLSRRQPIRPLAKITKQRRIHLAKEFTNERRPQLRLVVKESGIARARAGLTNIPDRDLAFPLGIEQIPIGLEILHPRRVWCCS